jgi:transposase
MEMLVDRCAGIDIGKAVMVVTVRRPDVRGRREQETRTFGTTVSAVLACRDWLVGERVSTVAMEATSDYWKPVYYLLEDAVDEVQLLNARHLKAVPGRKTDVKDSEWIAQLTEHGLVTPSFVPPPVIRELRDLTRYRKTLIEERTREVQRLEKLLEDAGIKLSSVASHTLGASGRAMIEALIAGERDPQALAGLAKGRLRRRLPELTDALHGRFRDHHALLASEMLTRIDATDAAVARLCGEIERVVTPFRDLIDLLSTIPGISQRAAEVILAEIGTDMTVFGTAERLASWAGMCPGNNESAGKRKSGRTRQGSKALRGTLVTCAYGAARTKDTYLRSQFWRLAGRRGRQRAAVAVGHTLLVIAFHVIDRRKPYQELGGDYFTSRMTEQAHIRRLVRQLELLGQHVTVEPAA